MLRDAVGLVLDLDLLDRYGWRIVDGIGLTLKLVTISVAIGFPLAFGLALARMSRATWIAAPAAAYVAFFRGTPLLCQLFLVYYGAGQFRPFLTEIGLWTLFRDAFFCAAFTFVLNTTAYQAEVLRGAIGSVSRGQREAARALGLSPAVTMLKVVAPQAMIVALRPLGNELIIMVKASSVASLVTLFDLMGTTRFIYARTFDFTIYLYAAAIYLALVEIIRRVWAAAEARLTRHLSPRLAATAVAPEGVPAPVATSLPAPASR